MGDVCKTIDIDEVSEHFEACIEGDYAESVNLEEYVLGYREINKFFAHLGSIFAFVKDDVDFKCSILEKHYQGPKSDFYKTVFSMVNFEISCGLIDAKDIKHGKFMPTKKRTSLSDPKESSLANVGGTCNGINAKKISIENIEQSDGNLPSGSRSLLRLHRALTFVSQVFITALHSDQNHNSTIRQGIKQLYDQTLAAFHPWIVRKGVHLALLAACPPRQKLLACVSYDGSMDDLERKCERLATIGRKVTQSLQKIFEENGILDLP